jgi:SAM-dependent methyltransferase
MALSIGGSILDPAQDRYGPAPYSLDYAQDARLSFDGLRTALKMRPGPPDIGCLDFGVSGGYDRFTMREQLLESLVCPACGDASWQVECRRSGVDGVIEDGQLICVTCQASYEVSDGIVDLLPRPSESILRERAGWERFLSGATGELDEAWLLALPYIDESVTSNADNIAHWKKQANNFEQLIQHSGLSGSEKVLELGAGRCWASAYLARAGCEVVALDVVRAKEAGGLEIGEVYLEHGIPYFDRVLATMEKLPFRRGTFDVVLSVASIHHSPLLDQVMAECARVLRPGGKLALTSEPCIRILKEKRVQNAETEAGINEHTYNILDYRRAFGVVGLEATYYLPGALSAMLEGAGLEANAGVFKTSLFRLTRLLWGKEAMRRLLRSQPANFLGLLFLEYGLTVVAEKQPGVGVP